MTPSQKDSSAASGELVGEVKKDRSTGIPYIDWKRDHTLLPVGFKLYGARAPQATTPLQEQDERALFESALAASFPDLPKRKDAIASNAKVIGYAMFQAGIAQGRSKAAPEAPALDPMLDECAANMNGHRFGPHGINGERQCEWCAAAPAVTPEAPSREAAPLDEIRSAASDLLKYLDDHDWGGIPEGATADRLRAAVAQQGAAQGGTTGKGEQRGK